MVRVNRRKSQDEDEGTELNKAISELDKAISQSPEYGQKISVQKITISHQYVQISTSERFFCRKKC